MASPSARLQYKLHFSVNQAGTNREGWFQALHAQRNYGQGLVLAEREISEASVIVPEDQPNAMRNALRGRIYQPVDPFF